MNGVSVSRYALGAAALVILSGSLGTAAFALRRRHLPQLAGAPARLAETVIGLAVLTAILELLGTVGLFSLVPITLASVACGAGAVRALRARRPAGTGAHGATPGVGSRRVRVLAGAGLAAIAVAVVSAEWAGPTLQSYDVGIRTFDSLWYHLPWAAWFAQTGRVTPLRYIDVQYLTPFYPATSELYHGLGIVLFGRDTASPGLNLVWLGLTLLAAWCVGSRYRVGPAAVLGAAIALGTPMMDGSQAGSAANDIVGVFFLLAAVALVPGDCARTGSDPPPPRGVASGRGPLVLAAVAAGLAAGTKLTLLAPVLALSVGVVWLAGRGRRGAVALMWIGPAFLAGGFWYVRNLFAVGNPLPWLSVPGLAHPAAALQQHTGFSVAHYLTDTHILTHTFGPALKVGLGPWWPALLAGAVLGPLLCAVGHDRRRRMLGAVALVSLLAYLLTPESAAGPRGDPLGFAFNLRYSAPALTLSLTLLPIAPALAGGARRRLLTVLSLAVVLVATVAQARLWPARHVGGSVGLGLAAGALCLAAALLLLRPPVRPGARVALAALAGLLLLAGAASGLAWERHYVRGRYQYNPGVSYLARVWNRFRTTHHVRVGVAGSFGEFFAYPLFGPEDANRVVYLGQRGAHGGFAPIATCVRWRAAVNAAHLRYVVTTPSRDPWHPDPLSPSPEAGWTASDPAAQLVYQRRATGQKISVFLLTGPLDPAGCAHR